MKTTERIVMMATIVVIMAGSAGMAVAGNNGGGASPCMAVLTGSREMMGSGNSEDDQEFGGNQQGQGNEPRSYKATSVIDIDFAIVFSPETLARYSNSHWVEFRVLGPKGNLYQSIAIPFTADAKKAGERHRVPGYPELIPVQLLKPIQFGSGQGMIAKVRLPVAGTPIVNNSLYGRWKAVAYIDGETVSCSLPAEFVITQ